MGSAKLRPLLRWSNSRWFGVHLYWSDASQRIIEEVKGLPVRAWDSMSKTWWLPETFLPHVEAALAADYGSSVPNLRQSPAFQTLKPTWLSNDPYAVLCVTRQAPDSVVEAAYRVLCRELDPDRGIGGSTEPQDRVHQAYAQIAQERAGG